MSTHHLQLFAEDGEIRPRLTCTATPDAVCRRRPVDTDQESWTDEDETTPGHECWAVEWAEDAGWDTVTAADGILSSVDVEVTYDEGVVVDLTPPQPTLPDLAEPSDAEVRAAAEESERHEQWGYDENGFPRCECGASLVESEHDLGDEPQAIGRTESDGEAAVSRVFELVPGDHITAGDIVIFDRKPRRIIARSAVFLPADDLLPAMQMIGLYYRTE